MPDQQQVDIAGLARWGLKPGIVEAVQLWPGNGPQIWEWADSKPTYGTDGFVDGLAIYTKAGRVRASFGDWIIKHGPGNFGKLTAEEFAATFDPAREPLVMPADEFAALKSACRLLGKSVVGNRRAMEAARIELAQGDPHAAIQWILNSQPDVWDDPETEWDGKESANEWWERTDGFYRAAVAGAEPSRAKSPAPAPAEPRALSTGAAEPVSVAAALDREQLGQIVRRVWVSTAMLHADPKPSWLVPWEGLGEWDKEVDRRIGEAVAHHAAAVVSLEMCRAFGREIGVTQIERDEARAKLTGISAYLSEHRGDAGLSLAHVWDLRAIIGGEGEAGRG